MRAWQKRWWIAAAARCHPERSEAKRNEVEGSPDVRQKRLFNAEGDLSTILLRKIASGTAQDDSWLQRLTTKRFCKRKAPFVKELSRRHAA